MRHATRALAALLPATFAAFIACGGGDSGSDAAPAGSAGAASGGAGGSAGAAGAAAGAAGGDDFQHGPFTPPTYAPGTRPAEVTFPATFLFGSASAGQQVESGLKTDWVEWAKVPGKVATGEQPDGGPDFFAHVTEDVAAMKDAKLGAYRFSIELARVFPTRESFDQNQPDADGLAKYDQLLDKLKTAGITPMVTLHHFAWPSWMSAVGGTASKEKQGWERPDVEQVFVEWARRAATRWGKQVDWWVTVNEPNVASTVGYVLGAWPPGAADAERMAAVQRAQVFAHAKAYDAIHQADTVDADGDGKAAMVSMALHQRVYQPRDAKNPEDVAAADHATYFWNYWYLHALVRGDYDHDFDERLDGPMDKKAAPELAGRFDYVGLNYYGRSLVAEKAAKVQYMGSQPSQMNLPGGLPKSQMGWDIYADGFGEVMEQLKPFGLPVFITENGVAAQPTEPTRARYVASHLFEVGWAIARGLDVRGYTYWSTTDNFEWQSGYCPQFGLYTVDFSKPDRPRSPANGRDTLAEIATSRKITQSSIDALPAYPDKPGKSCKSL